mgnify:CR=1 FL=1
MKKVRLRRCKICTLKIYESLEELPLWLEVERRRKR